MRCVLLWSFGFLWFEKRFMSFFGLAGTPIIPMYLDMIEVSTA